MSLHVLANHMASKGRGGDSMLVHMTPGEVQTLQKMAEKLGGNLTINPETGLPEANFLKKMLPMIAGLALAPLTAGTSLAFLGATPFATALTVGGITGLATGSLSKGLMAGLGAYGGASLGASLATAGTGAITSEVGNAALTNAGLTGEAAQTLAADEIVQKAVSEKLASATPWEKIGAGFEQATSSGPAALDFAKANKGPLAAAGMSYMAGQDPAKLDIPTTTQSPAMIRPMYKTQERIMPGDPDYRTNEAGSQVGYFRTNYTVPEPYPAAANGGIVALADGGMSDEQLSSIGTYLATNPSASDLSAAMQQFGVSQADVDRARSQMAPAQTAPANAFTVGSGPQVNSQQLISDRNQQIAQAGQGVQWGNPQSEAAFVENYYAGSDRYDPAQAEQILGLAPQTISGAMQNYQLGIGREKELAGRRAAGIDVSSSPYGGFSPAGQMAENERNEGIRAGTIPAPAPTPTAAPSPFTVGGAKAAAPSGIERLTTQSNVQSTPPSGQDLSGTAAGAFVGPNGTVITYDNSGKQIDTGKPASALNDYLTNPQESGVGSFVRGLSWGVSPEEDAKSSKKLYDYAKSRGLSSSELLKQSGLEGTGVTAQGLDAQWAQWNVQPTKPVDPYEPGSPIITPPPGRAPIPAPSVPVNPPKPPGWTGITGTPIPPKPTPTGGIPTLTTLTGDPYGLTPTAEKFTPPTRTGRSKEIYDYLSGKTATAPPSTRARSEAKAPAPTPGTTESAAPKVPDPAQQPVINDIYGYIQTLGFGTPESDAVATPKLSAEAAKKGWSIEQLSTASGFSVEALRKMFDKYGVSTPPAAAPPPYTSPDTGGLANGGYLGMAGGGLGSLGGYSDGGQLLRGPGDGVSDDIPATIGGHQPARLANNEFVIPARIVSELGNGSTEAGAKRLYQMMDRVQNARRKSIGKGNIAVDSKAYRHLPA